MIEGIRILPWLQRAMRNSPDAVGALNDCKRCMRSNTREARQAMGCGFEAPAPAAIPVVAWQPRGFTGPDLKHCPGYTTKLNEVVEASWARLYFQKGSLEHWCGAPANDQLLRTLEACELAYAAADHHDAQERAQEVTR